MFMKTPLLHLLLIQLASSWKADESGNTEIQPFQFPHHIKSGDKASATCMVMRGQSSVSYRWYKNGKLIEDSSHVKIRTLPDMSTLVVAPVTEDSAGNYTCVVQTQTSSGNFSAVLTVKAPPKWVKEPESMEVTEGATVSIICLAGGSPQPISKWKKMGESSGADGALSDASSFYHGNLSFVSVSKDQEGEYVCLADNGVGDPLEKQISVTIHGMDLNLM